MRRPLRTRLFVQVMVGSLSKSRSRDYFIFSSTIINWHAQRILNIEVKLAFSIIFDIELIQPILYVCVYVRIISLILHYFSQIKEFSKKLTNNNISLIHSRNKKCNQFDFEYIRIHLKLHLFSNSSQILKSGELNMYIRVLLSCIP